MRTSAIAAVCLCGLLAGTAAAQDTTATRGLGGFAEFGGRTFFNELEAQQFGKLREYNAVPKGLVLTSLHARYAPTASIRSYEVTGSNIGQLDQSLSARAIQPGLWDAQLRWDRIPHTYSTTARMLESRPSPDVFTLPAPRPALTAYNAPAPLYLAPVRTRWDPVKLALAVTPTAAWDMKAEYTRIAKSGDRPLGMVFGSSPGHPSREILEPIEQTTHDVRFTQNYAREDYQLSLNYSYSLFDNGYQSVTVDNPFNATDTPTAGSSRGRTALAPSNAAQGLIGTGGWNLPYRTRLTATYAYSWWRQRETMLPPTINTALASDPRLVGVPTNLEGEAGTQTLNLQATSSPIAGLALTARFRRFEFRDEAAVENVPVRVQGDRVINTTPIVAHRNPFRREHRDVAARWSGRLPVSIGLEYGWELLQLNPEERNIHKYTESTPRVTVDYTGFEWAELHARYSVSRRRSEAGFYENHTGVLPEFRRYDQADRDRKRFTGIASVYPHDEVSVTGTWTRGTDTYVGTTYGVQRDDNSMIGLDVDYTPSRRYAVGAGWSYEKFSNRMRARYRTPTFGSVLSWDWVGDNVDDIASRYGSATAIVLPNKLDVGLMLEWSDARTRMDAFNPTAPTRPTGASVGDSTNAVAVNMPEIRQTRSPASVFARYRITPQWAATARLEYERYRQTDWRTRSGQASLNPFNATTPTVMHIFLGNDFRNYDATFLTITMTYSPGTLRPWRPGRSAL